MGSETTRDLLAKAYEMQRTDAAIAVLRERDYWERRALQAEAQLALRARPLPADVQEVVERLRRDLPDPSLGIEHWAAKWVSNGDLRTLLAHLQRTEG